MLKAIEKEERQIAAAVQSARECVEEAHNSHKHMQLLIAQLRNRVFITPNETLDEEEMEELEPTESDPTPTVQERNDLMAPVEIGEPE